MNNACRFGLMSSVVLMCAGIALADIQGQVTVYDYSDGSGGTVNTSRPVRIYSQDGSGVLKFSDTTYTYDSHGRDSTVRRRATFGQDSTLDEVTTTAYTWKGQVGKVTRTCPNGDAVTKRTYDNLGRLTKIEQDISASDKTETQYYYDKSGNVEEVWVKVSEDTEGSTYLITLTDYNSLGQPILVTDPEGNKTVNVYNSLGQLIHRTRTDSSDTPLARESWVYDKAGRQTQHARYANAAGTSWTPSTTTDRVTDYTYDADGKIRLTKTYNMNSGTVITHENQYDDFGRLERTIDPENHTTTMVYESGTGLVETRTTSDGLGTRTITYGYDEIGQMTSSSEAVDGQTITTQYQYDGMGRRIAVFHPNSSFETFQYNLLGRQVRRFEDYRVTDSVYDPLGNLVALVAYNVDGLITMPDVAVTADDSDLASPPDGWQVTWYEYDLAGRRTKILYPDSTGSTDAIGFDYDLAGRMTERTDQRGVTTAYTYDDRSLLTHKSVTTTGFETYLTFVYDALGRMTWAKRGDSQGTPESIAVNGFGYDDMDNLTSESQKLFGGTTRTVGYDHDQKGNRIQITYPNLGTAVQLDYVYDTLNRVDTVQRNSTNLVDYDYTGRFLTNRAVTTGSTTMNYSVTYDDRRRIQTIRNAATGGDILAGFSYEYDVMDNRTATIGYGNNAADLDVRYSYDTLNRLTQADYSDQQSGSEIFRYDILGNRVDNSTAGTHGYEDTRGTGGSIAYGQANDANEYTEIDEETVLHDAAGNLTLDETRVGYSYDFENKLTQIFVDTNTNGSYDSGETELVTYDYDALGRRIRKVDSTGQTTETTRFYYDGQNVILETDDSDQLQRYFVHGSQYIDERVLMTDMTGANPTDYVYLLKELYSVAGLADTNGALVEAYGYDAYGKTAVYESGAIDCDIDDDNDVDLEDFRQFQECFNGNAQGICAGFDIDADNDVDLSDLATFEGCFSGPALPPLVPSGDWNDNGAVDLLDAMAFDDCIVNNPAESVCVAAFDFNSNGAVDLDDAGVFASQLGTLVGAPVTSCLASRTKSTVGNPYYFTGRRLDWVSHLANEEMKQVYYYRARIYDPVNGRFGQRDPEEYLDGMLLYIYTMNNPCIYTDAYGLAHDSWYIERFNPSVEPVLHIPYDFSSWIPKLISTAKSYALPTEGCIGDLITVPGFMIGPVPVHMTIGLEICASICCGCDAPKLQYSATITGGPLVAAGYNFASGEPSSQKGRLPDNSKPGRNAPAKNPWTRKTCKVKDLPDPDSITKPAESGLGGGAGGSITTEFECRTGVSGGAIGKVSAAAGLIVAGVKAEAECHWELPGSWGCSTEWSAGAGTLGASVSGSLTGYFSVWWTGDVPDMFKDLAREECCNKNIPKP